MPNSSSFLTKVASVKRGGWEENFSVAEIKKTVTEIKKLEPQIFIEISGGINQDNLAEYGKLKNINIISCGFLTHSANALDLSLSIANK